MTENLKKLSLAVLLACSASFGVQAEGDQPEDGGQEAVEAAQVLAAPDKRNILAHWMRYKHRKELMRTVVASIGGVLGGNFVRYHAEKQFKTTSKDSEDMKLFKKVAFDKPIGDIFGAAFGLGFDCVAERLLAKDPEGSTQLESSSTEKLLCYAATDTIGAASDFLGFDDADPTKPTFGPAGLGGRFSKKDKSKSFSSCDTYSVPLLFAISTGLRAFKNGQYKDYVGKDKALPEALSPACDQVANVTKFLDLEKMNFTNLSGNTLEGRIGQNKLIAKSIAKAVAATMGGRVISNKGKSAKYNEFMKAVAAAVVSPFVAVAVSKVHPVKK